MTDININSRIKGCNNSFINYMAKNQFYKGLNVDASIDYKTFQLVSTYNIRDCLKIILSNDNLYNAFIRSNKSDNPFKFNDEIININNNVNDNNNQINDNKKIINDFHRKLAFDYVKEIINKKIEYRVNQIINFEMFIKNNNSDKTCSICLGEFTNNQNNVDIWFISNCDHLFHKKCISKWRRNSCPLCRKRNYK